MHMHGSFNRWPQPVLYRMLLPVLFMATRGLPKQVWSLGPFLSTVQG